MAIRRRERGGVVVLSPRGSLFGDEETDELQQAITEAAEAGHRRLILNLTDCESMNSIAIGVLMRGFARVRGLGGEIKLCGLGRRVRDLFTMTKLIQVFDHHDTEDQAVAAFEAA